MDTVMVERTGTVTVVTLSRPEVHNCIDGKMADGLTAAIEDFAATEDAHVMVLGAGGRAFSSGADLRAVAELVARPDAARTGPLGFSGLDPGKPTIAAIEGCCFAGGLELACWCDVRVAGATAEFGVLSRRWGVPHVDGGTQRLPRIVGLGHALYLLETGIRIDAARALAMGLVEEVVPEGRALARAVELAEAMAAYPQASLRSDRSAALAALGLPLPRGLALEAEAGGRAVSDPEMAEGLARFAWGDRPESPVPPEETSLES